MLPRGLWRKRDLWLGLLLFSAACAALCAPLLLHTLGSEQLASAISYPVREESYQKADLGWQWLRLGLMSVFMALLGVVCILRWRRRGLLWLALAVVFNAISLGITINCWASRCPVLDALPHPAG